VFPYALLRVPLELGGGGVVVNSGVDPNLFFPDSDPSFGRVLDSDSDPDPL
jgi:hypothetical protein